MNDHTDEFSFMLKPSTVSGGGVGVFATHGIKAGTKLAIMPEGGGGRELDRDAVPEELGQYCIELGGGKILCPDEFNHMWIDCYINHANKESSNTILYHPEDNYYYYAATKDIQKGEELFVDYNVFEEPEDLKEEYYK